MAGLKTLQERKERYEGYLLEMEPTSQKGPAFCLQVISSASSRKTPDVRLPDGGNPVDAMAEK